MVTASAWFSVGDVSVLLSMSDIPVLAAIVLCVDQRGPVSPFVLLRKVVRLVRFLFRNRRDGH